VEQRQTFARRPGKRFSHSLGLERKKQEKTSTKKETASSCARSA
jgi:hypothetical protein